MRRWGKINFSEEAIKVDGAVQSLEIDTRAKSQVKRLSGGNQQKVTIGRWVTTGFDLLLCFDPTRGIDVGTKAQIYDLIRKFADEGKSVLLFTSELREIQLACDRSIVLYEGRVQADLPFEKCDEESLLSAAHGIVSE
jgi:ribose transport system ATP-binding protein